LDEETTPGRTSIRVSVDKKTFILCSLIAGQLEQQNLDLVFTEGEEITFSVSGKKYALFVVVCKKWKSCFFFHWT